MTLSCMKSLFYTEKSRKQKGKFLKRIKIVADRGHRL